MFYRYVVIDEVDRMLDMGFSDVVDDILQESYSYGNWNRHFKSWSMYIDFEQVSYFKREREKEIKLVVYYRYILRWLFADWIEPLTLAT